MKHIVVLGSTNTDMVVTGRKIPVRVCDFASAADSDDPANAFSIWF